MRAFTCSFVYLAKTVRAFLCCIFYCCFILIFFISFLKSTSVPFGDGRVFLILSLAHPAVLRYTMSVYRNNPPTFRDERK